MLSSWPSEGLGLCAGNEDDPMADLDAPMVVEPKSKKAKKEA